MAEEVDILYPLATLHWERPDLPVSIFDAQYEFVNDMLYVGSGQTSFGTEHFNPRIFVFSSNFDLLSELTTTTYLYVLTTYNSQLVLVGGRLSFTNRLSNQLWIRNEGKCIWDSSLLPPMPTARSSSSAINVGSRECIVVAGGCVEIGPVDVVEALIEGQWCTHQPLPKPCWNMTSTLHNGKWYLNSRKDHLFCCNLESLISSSYVGPVWSIIDYCNTSYQSIASFGQQLITIRRSEPVTIHALSPLTQSWVHVGDTPEELLYSSITILPTRELVVIGERSENVGFRALKASLTMSPYNPDSQFSMNALSRLEATGIQIITSLYDLHTELEDILDVDKSWSVSRAISEWVSGRSHHPPTWRALHDMLRELDLVELSQQIEDYLSGAPDYQAYMSSLSPCVRPLLEQAQLDWDHGGVDVDLNEIADHMLDWEDRLSAHLGLTHIDIGDINKIHLYQPPLQRREALKRWRNRCGLRATYGNLLMLCVDAGHTECAQVICDILKRKSSYYAVEPHTGVSPSFNVSTVGDSTAHSIDSTSLESPPTESYTTPPASRGGCLSLVTFFKEEDFPADKAEELGTYLGINPGRISTLKRNNVGNADEMLSAILSEWFNNDGEKSWKKLADALRHLGHSLMADKIASGSTIPLGAHSIDRTSLESPPTESNATTPASTAPDYQAYMSSLSPHVHSLLEKQLDWDHGGVDVNLNEIADHMLDWEDRLSTHLGLTHIAISDIKKVHLHQPPLQRREALKRWRNRCGLHATYGNLLKLCVDAGHTECAQVICDILKRKEIDLTSGAVQFDSTGGVYHDTAHGVVIRIPKGAIPENLVINLDVKATLTSTLKLPEDYRSVSPITELCIKDDPQFKFLEPIEVILPHFLDIKDHKTLPICFMKAEHGSDHFKHLDKNQEQSFDYPNYATLKTNHLCHLCIAAGKTEVRDKFNLIRVIPQVRSASGWSMYFYVIYDLPTCKSAVNEHYEDRKEFYEIVSCDDFKFSNDHLEIIYDENLPKGWILACASSKQVYKDSVHFDKFDEKALKEMCDEELYPPRFIINVIGKTDDPILTTFTFKGADRELHSQVILTYDHPREYVLTGCAQDVSENLKIKGLSIASSLDNDANKRSLSPAADSAALDYQAYMSSLSPRVHPLLEKLLDWDHGGVDVDLNEIADHMLDWEDRLSAHLGLTRIDISDIKKIYLLQPPLQRLEALKRWKNRYGLRATYGNLLKLCVETGHTECAQVICDILKRKGDGPTQFDSTSDRPTQFDSAGGIYHNTAHGVVITIPEGAIPENLVIKLDVKATLTSTLMLPKDYRSVSPITGLCIKNDPQFKFLKPIEVTLPHFLDINDHETLPICFMKAEHGSDYFKHLDKNQEQSFDYPNYAILKTNHLCHLCIAAGKTEVRDKFNLIRVIPQVRPASGWSMYFYVIYDLPTCKSAVNEHYENREESYEIISCDVFKFTNDHLKIIYDENLPKGWILACASSKQVYKDSVHYDKFDEKLLEERCDKELYPPRFIINVRGQTGDPICTTFTFKGGDRKLQSQVILSLANEMTHHPRENVFTGDCLSLVSIKTFFKKEDFPANKAEELGTFLGIKPGRISTLKNDNVGNADGMLGAILLEWLENDGEKSWKKLADALKHIGHSLMADKIESGSPIPSGDVREFSEDLSSGDLYRYLLFKHVPRRDCDIIKEREISGPCFLELSIQYWESCGVSEPGVIVIAKLQKKIKATQTTIIPNPSPHVPDTLS